MKNVYLIPTDKPSRLLMSKRGHLQFLKDNASLNPNNHFEGVYQNIYITSSEELNDYVIQTNFEKTNTQLIQCVDEFQVRIANDKDGSFTKKKIILTTDQSLDGVQAIDDDFLEWFVNNPSCEEFKVIIEGYKKNGMIDESTSYKYKIITPKEEQKQHLIDIMKGDEELGLYDEESKQIKCYCGHTTYCDCSPLKVKQETIEEAAERFYPVYSTGGAMEMLSRHQLNNCSKQEGFIEGAKWMQEQFKNHLQKLDKLCGNK